MSKTRNHVLGLIVIPFLVAGAVAKEWRGIKPLHSTRTDVMRILGSPTEQNDLRSIYRSPTQEVYVVFSSKEVCGSGSTNIPAGTVLLVQVTPKTKRLNLDTELDMKTVREFNPSSQDPDWKGLIDEENGLIVRKFKNMVDKVFYIPPAKDWSRCASYYANPEHFARIFVDFLERPFDEYSDLPFAHEKARLDNFAIYLQKNKPTWNAYIVGYASPTRRLEMHRAIQRARRYLITVRGIARGRILAIDGGRRDGFTTELYAVPPESPPPFPLVSQ